MENFEGGGFTISNILSTPAILYHLLKVKPTSYSKL